MGFGPPISVAPRRPSGGRSARGLLVVRVGTETRTPWRTPLPPTRTERASAIPASARSRLHRAHFPRAQVVHLTAVKAIHTLREMAGDDTKMFMEFCVMYEDKDSDLLRQMRDYRRGGGNDNAAKVASHIKSHREARARRTFQMRSKPSSTLSGKAYSSFSVFCCFLRVHLGMADIRIRTRQRLLSDEPFFYFF